jgi:4,5-dihydroxyphthalate decarboxylase
MTLRLKTTCAPNPRLQPLVDGEVTVDGIEFNWQLQPVPLLFRDNIANDGVELSEMSISETLLTIDRRATLGRGRWDWWALPAFLSRGHFWGGMYVNAASGIQGPDDLKGKQIGVPDYPMTAALWMRIVLKDLFGIEASDNEWHNLRPLTESQAIALELDKDPPPGIAVHWEPHDDPLALLERGALDAAIGVGGPAFEFFRKTGCFQANHHFIVQRSLIEGQPEMARALYEGFQRSKLAAYARGDDAYLLFEGDDRANQASVYGDDPFPLGLAAMSRTLRRAIQGSLEQGLIRMPVALEDVYHPLTLNT